MDPVAGLLDEAHAEEEHAMNEAADEDAGAAEGGYKRKGNAQRDAENRKRHAQQYREHLASG